jgi:indolepyruvate decarboxylase
VNNNGFTVGDYLLKRLAEVGVRHLFGVPGDYNLAFLDHVLTSNITWAGNCNELNAAYSADGYARVNGIGALLTTYGVGELSAANGIAGAYAEYVPVVHIVGAPSNRDRQRGALKHHTLGDGDYTHFQRVATEFTVAQAYPAAEYAPAEIDRVIGAVLRDRRPGYIVLPTDVAAGPAQPPATPLAIPQPQMSDEAQQDFAAEARRMLAAARSVTVLADFLAARFDVRSQLRALLDAGSLPFATLAMGKGVLDETDHRFVGVYGGSPGAEPVRKAVEDADVLIGAGVRFTDNITAGFSQKIRPDRFIDLQPFQACIGDRHYCPLPMAAALDTLTSLMQELGRTEPQEFAAVPRQVPRSDPQLHQDQLWNQIQDFLQPDDIIVAEQGTSFFGIAPLRLPSGVTFIGQPLWGSIGYTLPAAYGAQTAAPGRRVLLFIGDGSTMLTAQEMSSMIRDGLHPIIFLLNNDGYTVERVIHGPTQRYNDIANWDWALLPKVFGADDRAVTFRAATAAELSDCLQSAAAAAGRLVLLEATLPALDSPPLLDAEARASIADNTAGY